MVELGARRIRDEQLHRTVLERLPDQQLVIGGDLQHLHRRVAVDGHVERG